MVLGVSGDGLFGNENAETLKAFREQTRVTFPLLLGTKAMFNFGRRTARISPFPLDVLLDRKGTIRYVGTKFDRHRIAKTIDALLAESS